MQMQQLQPHYACVTRATNMAFFVIQLTLQIVAIRHDHCKVLNSLYNIPRKQAGDWPETFLQKNSCR